MQHQLVFEAQRTARQHRRDLQSWVRNLPVGHLQLGGYSSALHTRHSRIGDLLDSVEKGGLSRSSPTAARRIKRTLDALTKALSDPRPNGWDRFRKVRPPFRSSKVIYFASPRLSALHPREEASALSKMHLSSRAINALRRAGINTIGDLIRQAQDGLIGSAGLAEFKGLEVVARLDSLADAAQRDGSIDWLKFARICGFRILPHIASTATPQDLIREFPSLCKAAVASSFSQEAVTILQMRLLQSANAHVPRPAIALQLRKNRETVRLRETEVIKALRDAIWNEDYRDCRFRFRQEFLAPLHRLRASLKKRTSSPFWTSALEKCWGVDRQAVSGQEILLLRLVGIDPQRLRRAQREVGRAHSMTRGFLRKNRARRFRPNELRRHLVNKLGPLAPSHKELVTILQSLPTLEQSADGQSFATRFHSLAYTERYEVILRNRGRPMHLGDLTAAIVALSPDSHPPSRHDTAVLLSASPRFIAVGRTGYWALREWRNVETRTIVDIAAELLASSGRPLHESQLLRFIGSRRPVAASSIGSLLRHDLRFVRVLPRTWTLKTAVP